MADAFEMAIASGDRRASLIAIREYLAHELGGHRCKACQMSQLRTGDTAALVLRLQKVLEEIEQMPASTGEVTQLDAIRARRNGTPAPQVAAPARLGTKSAPRQQGGRKPSGTRQPGT